MTKVISQVRELRANGKASVFNMEAAMQALAVTPAKSHTSNALGAISDAIVACCRQAGTPLAINQIVAMLKAGGIEVANKKVSDKCWALAGGVKATDTDEERAKKEEKALLVKLGGGMYQIKA